jgi:hypothetical protein
VEWAIKLRSQLHGSEGGDQDLTIQMEAEEYHVIFSKFLFRSVLFRLLFHVVLSLGEVLFENLKDAVSRS